MRTDRRGPVRQPVRFEVRAAAASGNREIQGCPRVFDAAFVRHIDWRSVGLSELRKQIEMAIPALRRYARALTRDAETADDIVQDTLLRALRSEHLFHGGDARAWLYTILTNLNRNRLRTLVRQPAHRPINDGDAATSGPESGGRDISRALEELSEESRSALLLVVLEGLSYRDVAEVQGVPIGTVMSRLSRARAQIRSYFDGERPTLRRVK